MTKCHLTGSSETNRVQSIHSHSSSVKVTVVAVATPKGPKSCAIKNDSRRHLGKVYLCQRSESREKMQQLGYLLLLVFATSCLVSCAGSPKPTTLIEMNSIDFERGLRRDDVEHLSKAKPASTFEINYLGRAFLGEMYRVQVGTRNKPWVPSGVYCEKCSVPVLGDYVFVFENNRLQLWGSLSDLEFSEDALALHLFPLIWEKRTVE